MLWALIFIALSKVIVDDSPFLLTNLEKPIKKQVEDKERKEHLLVLIQLQKNEIKYFIKANKILSKEMHSLFINRETTHDQFDDIAQKVIQTREALQLSNRKLAIEIRNNVTKDEWEGLKLEIIIDTIILDKQLSKSSEKLEKRFDFLRNSIEKTIKDKVKRNRGIEAINDFQNVLAREYKEILSPVLDQKSIIYQYKVSESEMIDYQLAFNKNIDDILKARIMLHFKIVENSSMEEWKKINYKINLPL